MKRPSAAAMALRLGVGAWDMPSLRGALGQAREALANKDVTGKQREAAASQLMTREKLARQLNVLHVHWRETKNSYFAIDALVLAVDGGFGPPAWALKALTPGLAAHIKHPERDLAVQLGLHRRGSGTTPPVEQYRDRRKLDPAMRDMGTLCGALGLSAAKAAEAVCSKYKLAQNPDTVARHFCRKWRPFYLSLKLSHRQLSADDLRAFRATFDPSVRFWIPKVRTKNTV